MGGKPVIVKILAAIGRGCLNLGLLLILSLVCLLLQHLFQSCVDRINGFDAGRRDPPQKLRRETVGEQTFTFFDNGDGATLILISNAAGRVAIPGVLGNRAVTKIEGWGLATLERLESVEIPGSVQSIGDGAFSSCENLETVRIGEGLTNIGFGAFSKCGHLQTIELPSTLGSIGFTAFSRCIRLKSLVVPSGVRNIGQFAFSGCEDLEEVVLPDGLLNIGDCAFAGCRRLKYVDIPNSVTNAGRFAFDRTPLPPPDDD